MSYSIRIVERGAVSSRLGRVSVGLLLGVLFGVGRPAFAKDSVPDWVRAAAAQAIPKYSYETHAVVLLNDTTYTVAADGQAVEHVRRVVKILRPQGRDEATIEVNFDKDAKLLSMNVWSIGADGHEYAMKDKEMTDEGYGGGIVFEEVRRRVAHAPAADPGAVIAYEYERRARPYLSETTWSFQEDIPSLQQSFTLELPAGYTFGTEWTHHPPAQAADLESQRWRWEMKDVPGIDLEQVPMAPSGEALAGRMTVHYAGPGIARSTDGTWRGIGLWYDALAKDRLTATPEIAAKAQELAAGKSDFFEKGEAIAEFVQKQVRYFAIEVGIGGYQPHAAGDVFHNRYGDCKDKATLVSAMLSAVGIHAALMMVDTNRGVVDPDAPSIWGNHMITAIEIPAGYESARLHSVVTAKTGRRYLIFDPTWDRTPFGQLEHDLQGGYGVLLEGADSQAIQLPVLDPALNAVRRSATLKLDADGVLKGTVTEKRFGDVSDYRREVYAKGDAKQQRDLLDQSLGRDFTTFSATDVKVENVDSPSRDLTVSYTLSADRYAKSMGPLLMVRPRVLGDVDMETDHKERKVPIDLDETMQAVDEYSIELPAGYTVDELPDPVKLDVGFASYQSAIAVKGNTLEYKRTYTVRQITLPAERYGDVQKLEDAIAADEESRAILKKQ